MLCQGQAIHTHKYYYAIQPLLYSKNLYRPEKPVLIQVQMYSQHVTFCIINLLSHKYVTKQLWDTINEVFCSNIYTHSQYMLPGTHSCF